MTYFNSLLKAKPLVIFEMANNHMGDVEHGKKLIRAYAALKNQFKDEISFAFKFQYRELNTFIHTDHKGSDLKYIKRFEETRLSRQDWEQLIEETRNQGFLTVCTPFDEPSVDQITHDNFDIIKIASCSLTDWPLLEKVSTAGKPVIASVAGSSDDEISNVAAFLSHHKMAFSLLYCVGMYPTESTNLNVSMLAELKRRYPHLNIGFSTHEEPSEKTAVAVAVGAGAKIFEKHVALPTESYAKNQYSTDIAETEAWLKSLVHAMGVMGSIESRTNNISIENTALRPLKRAVFAKRDLEAGASLHADDLYFAIPAQEDAMIANDLSKFNRIITKEAIKKDQIIRYAAVNQSDSRAKIIQIRNKIREMINEFGIVIPSKIQLEISYHYGLENFEKFGLCMLTIVNNEQYCKKLLFLMPDQNHPEQYHNNKHETFIVLAGKVSMRLDGVLREMSVGDVVAINPEQRHEFWSETGAVVEEISTHSSSSDSYYTDEKITQTQKRKSFVELI